MASPSLRRSWTLQSLGSLVLAHGSLARTFCEYPDTMLNANTTTRDYCRKMTYLNVLLVIPSVLFCLWYLTAHPASNKHSHSLSHSHKSFYRRLLSHNTRNSPQYPKPSRPYDPIITGLQLLFYSCWHIVDYEYPSSVIGSALTAYLLTYPIVPLICLAYPEKRANLLSIEGVVAVLCWIMGLLVFTFPSLNWTTRGIETLEKVTPWSALLSRTKDGNALRSIPWPVWINVCVFLGLGMYMLFVDIDSPSPFYGWFDQSTGFMHLRSSSASGSRSNTQIDRVIPGSQHEQEEAIQATKTTHVQEPRLVGYDAPRCMDLVGPGYLFVLFAAMMVLVALSTKGIDGGAKGSYPTFTGLMHVMAFMAPACLVASYSQTDRTEEVRRPLRYAALYCLFISSAAWSGV